LPKSRIGARIVVLLVIALVAVLTGVFMLADAGYSRLSTLNVHITAVQERQTLLAQLLRAVSDAEGSQRGLLLTREEKYLAPYDVSRQRAYRTLELLEEDYRDRGLGFGSAAIQHLHDAIDERFALIERTLGIYRSVGAEEAIEAVREGQGFEQMAVIRDRVRALEAKESDALVEALASWLTDLQDMRLTMAAMTLLNVLLMICAGAFVVRYMVRRADENTHLQREVRQRTHELAALSSHLQDLSEREKKTLSRDLHDALGGLLVATKMDVAWLRNRLKSSEPGMEERWERIQRSLDQGVDFKRRIVEQLRPTLLDNMGLFAALRWQFQETCSRAGVQGRDQLPEEEIAISSDAAIALFRVAQEALTNVLKHARATSINLTVEVQKERLRMLITDNGRGIVTSEEALSRGHGLASMRHRVSALAGDWIARRGAAGGTEISVEVPLSRILAVTPGQGTGLGVTASG
jgi:signal transduction histidine kinase